MEAESDPSVFCAPTSPFLSVLPDLPTNLGECTEQQVPWTLSRGSSVCTGGIDLAEKEGTAGRGAGRGA